MKHIDIKISGKVQDVFFRDTSKKVAEDFGLCGFVENHPDGTVYIEVEGDEDKINKFLAWCHHGPEEARVENVQIEENIMCQFVNFEIR